MAAGGKSEDIRLGAGRLWVAPLATAEPTNASTVLPSADWRAIGYTEDGTTISVEQNNEAIEVAEEYEPVRYVLASRSGMLRVSMAELTRRNLALAWGIGADEVNDASVLEPPEPGDEVAVMLVWDSNENAGPTNVRWLFRQGKVNGAVETQRNKAPNKALLPVEFNLEKPTGKPIMAVFPNAQGQV
jgi:hypothetical protein